MPESLNKIIHSVGYLLTGHSLHNIYLLHYFFLHLKKSLKIKDFWVPKFFSLTAYQINLSLFLLLENDWLVKINL